jgi:ATP-dependent DNA helicase DinG
LQDQLFNKDLPMVRDALKAPGQDRAAQRAGQLRLSLPPATIAIADGRFLTSRRCGRCAPHLGLCQRPRIPATKPNVHGSLRESSPVWGHATSTRENCLGQDCPDYKDCFVMLARREAMAADLVVVNHHLFFADVMLRDEGMAELLPACNTVIFDEAHQLPEVATLFFGDTVSTAQMLDLARDARTEGMLTSARDCLDLPDGQQGRSRKSAKDLRLAGWPRQRALLLRSTPGRKA